MSHQSLAVSAMVNGRVIAIVWREDRALLVDQIVRSHEADAILANARILRRIFGRSHLSRRGYTAIRAWARRVERAE